MCEIGETEEVQDDVDKEITKTVRKCDLRSEKKPVKVIRAKGNFNCDPRTVKVFHTNFFEIWVKFSCKGLTLGSNLARVDYTRGGSTFLVYVLLISSIRTEKGRNASP